MKHRKLEHRVGIGSSLVLMILVVLAMTALGLLALGSARQTEAQTQRNLSASVDYYAAAAQAQAELADLDSAAAELLSSGASLPFEPDMFEGKVNERIEWTQNGDVLCFTLKEDAGAGRVLIIKGEVPGKDGARYILTSHALSASTLDEDNDLQLIGE